MKSKKQKTIVITIITLLILYGMSMFRTPPALIIDNGRCIALTSRQTEKIKNIIENSGYIPQEPWDVEYCDMLDGSGPIGIIFLQEHIAIPGYTIQNGITGGPRIFIEENNQWYVNPYRYEPSAPNQKPVELINGHSIYKPPRDTIYWWLYNLNGIGYPLYYRPVPSFLIKLWTK